MYWKGGLNNFSITVIKIPELKHALLSGFLALLITFLLSISQGINFTLYVFAFFLAIIIFYIISSILDFIETRGKQNQTKKTKQD